MTSPRARILALLLTTALGPIVWGTTYIVTTELLPPGRPLLAGLLRALPAGILLWLLTREVPRGRWWFKASVLGFLNVGGFFALLFVAAYRLPGGVAATLGAIQPIIAAVLAALLLAERLRLVTSIAGVLGVLGVALLVLGAEARLDSVGVIAGLAAAVFAALGLVLTKRWGRPTSLLSFTSWQLIAGGLFLLPLALLVEGLPPGLSALNLAGFLWLSLVGTAMAYLLFFRGLEALPVAQVSLLMLLSPVVAAVVGWLALGQTLNLKQLAGMAIVLGAIGAGALVRSAAAPSLPAPPRSPLPSHR